MNIQTAINNLPNNAPYEFQLELERLHKTNVATKKAESNITAIVLSCNFVGPAMFYYTPKFPCVNYYVATFKRLNKETCVAIAQIFASVFNVPLTIEGSFDAYFDNSPIFLTKEKTPDGNFKVTGTSIGMIKFKEVTRFDCVMAYGTLFCTVEPEKLQRITAMLQSENVYIK